MNKKFKISIFIILFSVIVIGIIFNIPFIIKNIPLYQGNIDLNIYDPISNQPIEGAEVRYEYYKLRSSMGFIDGGNKSLHVINEIILFSDNNGRIKLPFIKKFGEGWSNPGLLIRVNKNGYHKIYYNTDRPGRFYLADRNEFPRLSWSDQTATLYLFPILKDSLDSCAQITDNQLREKCIELNQREIFKKAQD